MTPLKTSLAFRIFDTDDRQAVSDTTTFPWSAVGMVEARWGRTGFFNSRTGSGVLISDRVVLCCGHVVHDSGIGTAQSISFAPARNGASAPFGIISVDAVAIRTEWSDRRDDDFDISLLLLTEPVGRETGTFAIASRTGSFFSAATLNMAGYPADLNWDRLYIATGVSSRVDGNLIVHYIDGGPGQSGGPVFYIDDQTGQPTVVGVYTGDVEVTEGNRVVDVYGIAVRIDSTLCQWINGFLIQNNENASPGCHEEPLVDSAPPCGSGTSLLFPAALFLLSVVRPTRPRRQ